MLYQITQQYARDDERFIAEFCVKTEAETYIHDHLETNANQRLNILYRLFTAGHCIKEYNKTKVGLLHNPACYAEGTRLLPDTLSSAFTVFDATTTCAAFCDLNDAEAFVRTQFAHGSQSIYRIIKDGAVLQTLNPQDSVAQQAENSRPSNSSVFRPTPLSTSPRPPGTPPPIMYDTDEEL